MRTIDGPHTPDRSTARKGAPGALTFWRSGLKSKLAVTALLIAAPVRAEDVATLTADTPVYTLRTPVEVIAANPAAAAVLNRDLPGLLTDPSYPIFKTMSLKQMQEASGGDLSAVDVNKALEDLQALPPR